MAKRDGEPDFWRAEAVASILQGLHSKLDRLTVGQQQIAISLGVALEVSCTDRVAISSVSDCHWKSPTKEPGCTDKTGSVSDSHWKSPTPEPGCTDKTGIGSVNDSHLKSPTPELGCADGIECESDTSEPVSDFADEPKNSVVKNSRVSRVSFRHADVPTRDMSGIVDDTEAFRLCFDECSVTGEQDFRPRDSDDGCSIASSYAPPKLRGFCSSDNQLENRGQSGVRIISTSKGEGKMRTPRASLAASLGLASASDDDDGQGIFVSMSRMLPLERYSRGVLIFDFLGVVLLFKDSIQVPYTVAYKYAWLINGERDHLDVISIVSATFWTLDLMLRFVISSGEEEESEEGEDKGFEHVTNAAVHYLKGWFIVDFVLVVFDWMSWVMEATQDAVPTTTLKFVRLIKISRIVRVIAVMRAKKFSHVKEAFLQKLKGHHALQVVIDFIWNILKLLVLCLWLNHFGACAWIILETEYSHGGKNWEILIAETHTQGAGSFADAQLTQTFRYSVAYFWAVSTMFSGSSYLAPMTSAECWFSSACVLFGVLSVTTIISSTSALLMRINEANRERMAEAEKLQTFLRQHKIRPLLSLQIQRQAMERSEVETRIAEQEVLVLSCLSCELRDQLRIELYAPVLRGQPFWRACDYIDDQMIEAMCLYAISFKMCTPGEIVFTEHSRMDGSFTLVWGSMKYSWSKHKVPRASWQSCSSACEGAGEYGMLMLLPGHTACEHALWTEWEAIGILEALTRCEVLVCSSEGLAAVMQQITSEAHSILRGFAQAVIDFIMLDQVTNLSDISTHTDYDLIVTFMPDDSRVTMSMPALRALKKHHGFARSAWDDAAFVNRRHSTSSKPNFLTKHQLSDIEQEVYDGTCNLGQDETDRVMRIVRVLVVNLRTTEGLICVELGHVRDDTKEPMIRLPGRKIRMQEQLFQSTQQLIRKRFGVFESEIEMCYGSVDVDVRPSRSYSITTKYIRLGVDASVRNKGAIVGTTYHKCAWGDESLECFARFDPDHLSVVIYAWMRPDQYEVLKGSHKHDEELAASWMDVFTDTEIADARSAKLLL